MMSSNTSKVAWHPIPKEIVNIIYHLVAALTHDVANCVTYTLEELAAMPFPKRQIGVFINAILI